MAALVEAGALRWHPLDHVPDSLGQTGRPEDGDLAALTGRRVVVESVVARAAEEAKGVEVRRGVSIGGLVAADTGRFRYPGVGGVKLESGEELPADLVVDAAGRRSPLPAWLAGLGGGPAGRGERRLRVRLLRPPLPLHRRRGARVPTLLPSRTTGPSPS